MKIEREDTKELDNGKKNMKMKLARKGFMGFKGLWLEG